jgi:hypothetical protein
MVTPVEGKTIDRDTGIAVGLVIALMGACAWLTTIYNQANANSDAIKELKDSQSAQTVILSGMSGDLKVIKVQLGIKEKND